MAQEQENLDRIMGYFLEEAKDNLTIIEQGLLNLGTTVQDSELMDEIYRAAHSIKGGSAMLGASSIRKTSHKLEDYFQILKERPPKISPKLESLLLQVLDGLTVLVENLEQSESEELTTRKNAEVKQSLTPCFETLDRMMQVEKNGADPQAEESTAEIAPLPSRPNSAVVERRSSNLPDPEESAKHLVFQSDVPTQLRQMLQGFKQPDTADSRQQLTQICISLTQAGENFNLSTWVDLVKLAQGAIANRDNFYADLAPVAIKELKRARDLVLAGTPDQIKPSSTLLNLQPQQSLTADPVDRELDTLLRVGRTPTEESPREENSMSDRFYNSQPPVDPPTPYSQRIGPDVGLSELNTLADLFKGETSDIELAWETEISSAPPENNWGLDSSEMDEMGDLSDFLIHEYFNDVSENINDNWELNLSKNEKSNVDSEDLEDDLKDLLEIEPTVMSNNPKKNQADELSDLFSEHPDATSTDLDELLQINLDSSEQNQSLENLDLDMLDTEETDDLALDLDLDSNWSEGEELEEFSEMNSLFEDLSLTEDLDSSSEEEDIFGLDENVESLVLDELDGNQSLENLSLTEQEDIFGLEESAESLVLDELDTNESLEDLSLTEDLDESSSAEEDIFGLEESGESLALDELDANESLENFSLMEDLNESSSEEKDIFGLEESAESLALDELDTNESLEDLSITEEEDIFDLDESAESLVLDELDTNESLEDLSLTEDLDESSSEEEDIFSLDEGGESLVLDELDTNESLEDLSLTEDLDESSSEEEDIFGLDENVESLALDELGANESLEDLSLTEDLDESSSEEEDIFGLDENVESLALDELGANEFLEDLSLTEEENIFGLDEGGESLVLDELESNESLEDLSLTEDLDESSSEEEDIFGLEESAESLALDELEGNESLEDLSLTEEEDIFGLEESSESLALDELDANESLEDLSLTEDSDSSELLELEVLEENESLEDFSPTEELDELDVLDTDQSNELVLEESEELDTFESSSEMIPEPENQETEDVSTPQDSDDFDLMMGTETSSIEEDLSSSDTSVDDFFNVSDSNLSAPSYSLSIDSDDFFTPEPIALDSPSKSSIFDDVDGRVREEEDSRSSSELASKTSQSESQEESDNQSLLEEEENHELTEELVNENLESIDLESTTTEQMDLDLGEDLDLDGLSLETQESEAISEEMDLDLGEDLDLDGLSLEPQESDLISDGMDLDLGDSSDLDGLSLEAQESDSISDGMDLDLGEDLDLDGLSLETQESEAISEEMDLDLGDSSDLDGLSLEAQESDSISDGMDLDLGEDLDLDGLSLETQESEAISEEMDLDLGDSSDLDGLSLEAQESDSISDGMDLDLGEDLDLDGLSLETQESDSISDGMDLDLGEDLDLDGLSLEAQESDSISEEMDLDLGDYSDLDGLSLETQESDSISDGMDLDLGLMIDSDEDLSQNTLIQEIDDVGLGEPLNPEPSDFTEDAGLDLDEPVVEEPSEGLDSLDFSLEIEENAPDDLSTLFSDEPEMLGDEESLDDLNELTLFEEDLGSTDETLESLDFGDDVNPVDSSSRQWQELEAFLGKEQKPRENMEIFTQLETFLDEPVILPSPSLRQEVSHTPAETLETTEGDFDDLEDLLADADQALGGPPTANATTARSPKAAKRVEQNMRVPIKQLDNLSNLVGELVVNRNSLEQNQERLRQCLDNLLYLVQQLSDVGGKMRDLYERSLLESALLSSRHGHRSAFSPGNGSGDSNQNDGWDHIEMDRFTPFHTLSQETIELIVRVRESSSDIEFIVEENDQVTRQFRQVTTQLQEGLTRTRMVPFAQTADRLPGAVRRIATGLNKQAEIHIEGKDTLIDKMIQEQLFDPMTHLINNAMTHGIETPEKRKKLGKPGVGKITVRAFHQGNQTVISVSDDGAGINTERVKSKALEKGLITPKEAESMSRLDIYDLLFHPGFSTKDKADNFAGRGVGMDVVRVALREIRGVITTDSTEGQGTTFTIRLPLTLSISKALCCISNHARVAFPMDGVEDMLDVPKDRVYANKDGVHCIKWRDTELPFRPLAELLQYNRTIGRGRVFGGSADDDIISIVILRSAGQYLALQVDQVLGEQEIVIKQLEGPIPKPVGVAGATVLGDGRIMPIADVLELIDLSMGRSRRDSRMWEEVVPPEPEPIDKSEPTVLIVDDSITVRELLSMTFVKSGYRVEQARNGLDAWEKLRAGLPCDMIFCDIEMPKLNGLELLERLQGDEVLREIPMAMLTSRGASKYQQHAASLGAKGYFTKPYLEEALLEAAQRMLKGDNLLAEISEEQSQETMAGT